MKKVGVERSNALTIAQLAFRPVSTQQIMIFLLIESIVFGCNLDKTNVLHIQENHLSLKTLIYSDLHI